MPRISWRGRTGGARRAADSPRPAGRRRGWAGRLRRGGVLARRVLRVDHRRPPGDLPPLPHHAHLPRQPAPAWPFGIDPVTETELAGLAAASAGATGGGPAVPGLLPGERTAGRRVRFLAVNACTVASLSLGLLAILLAMRGDVRSAAVCVIACVVVDGLDGALARRLGVASPFGAQMDSMADMCAFGIAAPVVVYASVAGSVPAVGAAVACALVAACAAIRLARFNIAPKDSRFFTGVPTTMAAGVIALAVLIDLPMSPTMMLLGVAALAFAMVSSFPYATLARLLRLPPWLWLAPLAGAMIDPRLTFLALVAVYLASGPVLWWRQRRTATA